MMLATVTAYILAIVVILGLSVKLMWLMFLLFLYRTYSSFFPFQTVSETLGFADHWIYFGFIFTLSVITYGIIWRFLREVPLLQFILLGVLVLWTFTHYSLSDIFFLKDYLTEKGLWNMDFYVQQVKEIFSTGPEGFSKLFQTVFENVWGIFTKIVDYLSNQLSK